MNGTLRASIVVEKNRPYGGSVGTLRPYQSIPPRHDIETADDAETMLKASHVSALSEEAPTIRV